MQSDWEEFSPLSQILIWQIERYDQGEVECLHDGLQVIDGLQFFLNTPAARGLNGLNCHRLLSPLSAVVKGPDANFR